MRLSKSAIKDMPVLNSSVISKASERRSARSGHSFYYSMCVHFPTLRCPSLFIRPVMGLLDDRAHVLDEREAAAFVSWTPNCQQVDLPDVNHYTMLLSDEPPVVPPIKEFLQKVYTQERQGISV
jgi:hypothetical protein